MQRAMKTYSVLTSCLLQARLGKRVALVTSEGVYTITFESSDATHPVAKREYDTREYDTLDDVV